MLTCLCLLPLPREDGVEGGKGYPGWSISKVGLGWHPFGKMFRKNHQSSRIFWSVSSKFTEHFFIYICKHCHVLWLFLVHLSIAVLIFIAFYRLAVKTGSVALQKFIYLLFYFILFFLPWFVKKSLFCGVKIFFPRFVSKTNGGHSTFFFYIFSQVLE